METISLKLDKQMLESLDLTLKQHHYGTRTEFIRTAIRDKLNDLSREDIIREFMKFRGKSKKTTNSEQNRKTREKVLLAMAKENGWKV